MTAEIVIMNKSAIALAADSAVTVQLSIKGEVRQKIYNTTNKLFMLSKYSPIGILVYGNADILGTPWELIIKEYRKKLATKKFSTIKAQALDFIKYLNTYFASMQQEIEFRNSVAGYFSEIILNNINTSVEKEVQDSDGINEEKIKEIVASEISSSYSDLIKRENLDGVPNNYVSILIRKYGGVIDDVIKTIFRDLPLKKAEYENLRTIAACLYAKAIFPDSSSGIIIAGFGEDEKFPSLFAINSHGVVNNHLKYSIKQDVKLGIDQPAAIIPFAQQDMVVTFIEGVDPGFNQLLDGYLSKIFNEYPKVIFENLSDIPEDMKKIMVEKLQKQGYDIYDKLRIALQEYKDTQNVSQITSVVEFLPKDELAAMAESLVNLTSFKRRVSLDAETVGGPVDVAVISKGDGFVWIKRKQYFKAELNPHFADNYYRDC